MAKPKQTEIATALGLSPGRVTQLKARGMPVHSIQAAFDWYRTHTDFKLSPKLTPDAVQAPNNEEPADGFNLQEERARREHHEANLAELKEMSLRGDLLPAAEVLDAWQGILAAVRAKLLALPSKLAAQSFAAKTRHAVEELLRTGINEALQELSDDGKPRAHSQPGA